MRGGAKLVVMWGCGKVARRGGMGAGQEYRQQWKEYVGSSSMVDSQSSVSQSRHQYYAALNSCLVPAACHPCTHWHLTTLHTVTLANSAPPSMHLSNPLLCSPHLSPLPPAFLSPHSMQCSTPVLLRQTAWHCAKPGSNRLAFGGSCWDCRWHNLMGFEVCLQVLARAAQQGGRVIC